MRVLPLLAIACLLAGPAAAQVPACDGLTPAQKALARNLLETEHPYACCDGTIAECLKTRPDCRLPARLAAFVCRRAASGQDRETVRRALEKRATSMMPGLKRHAFDLAAFPAAGSAAAQVRAVMYACARCPFCSQVVPALHREVTTGRLAGTVVLHVRPFPIKSHPGSAEANLAIMAAARLGKGWEYLLRTYAEFDRYTLDDLAARAAAVGLDRAAFEAATAGTETRQALVEVKKEGLRNGVEATPALFIDGRRYLGDLDLDTLVDVLEEAATR